MKWTNKNGLLLFFAIVLVIISIDISGVSIYYSKIRRYIENQPKNFHADAGIIFFGDYKKDKNDYIHLGSESKNRANQAIHLFNSGQIKNIICTGGYYYEVWQGQPNLMYEYLVKNGIPENRISYDSLSFNTITNWEEAEKIIRKKHFESIVVISAPLHIYRISDIIDFDSVYFSSYLYELNSFSDYFELFNDVHHEWRSNTLTFLFTKKLRHELVLKYKKTRFKIENFFKKKKIKTK